MGARHLAVTAIAITLFAWMPRAAHAQAADEAEELVAKGVALRQEGKDADALVLFKRAYEKQPSPRARAQIGLAEQALGMWLKAEEDLGAALESPDPWIAKYREPLEAALRTVKGRVGSLEVSVNVDAAEVLVDGAVRGRGPFRVEAGSRSLLVRSPGYHAVSRTVVVPGGGVARETIELVPAPPDAARGDGDGRTAPSDGSAQRVLGWSLLGGGGLLLIGGAAAQLARLSVVNAYNDDPLCPGQGVRVQPAPCSDRISTASTWQTVALVGYTGGGALALAGTIVVLTAPRAPRASTMGKAQMSCAPSISSIGGALSCAGSF